MKSGCMCLQTGSPALSHSQALLLRSEPFQGSREGLESGNGECKATLGQDLKSSEAVLAGDDFPTHFPVAS